MADKKAEVKAPDEKTPVDLLTWLKENPAPESITVTVEFGEGYEEELHFNRSIEAYERYVRNISEIDADGKLIGSPLTSGSIFLLDSIAKAEREKLAAFMNRYPATVADLSTMLAKLYTSTAQVKVKNVSKPAGPK